MTKKAEKDANLEMTGALKKNFLNNFERKISVVTLDLRNLKSFT